MLECDFKRWDIKGSRKPKRCLKLGQKSTRSNGAKLPAPTPHRRSLAAPVNKQLRNKSASFVFGEVRNTTKPWRQFLFLQTTCSQRAARAGMGHREGRATTPSTLLLVHGTDRTPRRGSALRVCFVSGLTRSHRDTRRWVPALLHPAWE